MLERLVRDSGVEQEILECQFKRIHQKYGTSEYSNSVEELPALQAMHPGEDLRKIYSGAIEAYRQARAESLRLFPGVLDTIRTLKKRRTKVIGYTESRAYYTIDRVSGLLTEIKSQTNSSDPNHIFLGYMTLAYYDNGMINEVNFTSVEVPPDPVTPLYSVEYAHDNDDRLFKMEIISHDENVPDLTVYLVKFLF